MASTPNPTAEQADRVSMEVLDEYRKIAAWLKSQAAVRGPAGDTMHGLAAEALTNLINHEYSRHTIPLYGMLDVWMAIHGTSHPEFDEFYAEHGYAETWAGLLDDVRRLRAHGLLSEGAPSEERRGINLMRDLGFDEYDPKVIKARADAAFEEQVERAAQIGFDRMAEACRDDGRWSDVPVSLRDFHVTLARYHFEAAGVAPQEPRHRTGAKNCAEGNRSGAPISSGDVCRVCEKPVSSTDSEKLIAEALEYANDSEASASTLRAYLLGVLDLVAPQPLDVDEEKPSGVIGDAVEKWADMYPTPQVVDHLIARAVVEYLKGAL